MSNKVTRSTSKNVAQLPPHDTSSSDDDDEETETERDQVFRSRHNNIRSRNTSRKMPTLGSDSNSGNTNAGGGGGSSGGAGGGGGVPAFLAKLWRLVDDPDTNNLICWSKDGRSFIIHNQAQFARELLPLNYKHNNMASFIRQLNMYGFHKITSIENGGLRFDKDEIEFSHPCFKRNYPYLLDHIKRKISNNKTVDDKSMMKQETVSKVLSDVKAMRGRQDNLDSRFSVMKQENEALWREVASLRQKHAKQQQIVNKLIQFLISIVQPSRNMSGVKRHMQLMINDNPENDRTRTTSETESEGGGGPVIHELSEELLDEVMNPLSRMTPTGSVSPSVPERPQSNISMASHNYDYSNQSAEDLQGLSTAAAGTGGGNGINLNLLANSPSPGAAANSPAGQQILYTVTEAPDSHINEVSLLPNSPYGDEMNVLTTPMVREQEARQLLKKKNKERRQATDAETVLNASSAAAKVQIKDEPVSLFTPTETPTQNAGSMVDSNYEDLYNVDFISNDMPTDIFEDSPIGLPEISSDAVSQQQQFGQSTVNNGKFANTTQAFEGAAQAPATESLLWDANLASTSKAAAAVKADNESQQQQQQQQDEAMTVAKYTGGNEIASQEAGLQRLSEVSVTGPSELGCESETNNNTAISRSSPYSEDVHGHLDNMQNELDALKNMLRGEGVSIDQNMLMGLFNDSDLLDNYGLQFGNEGLVGDKKTSGSELMAYQPSMYDLSDILGPEDDDHNKSAPVEDARRQFQTQTSVLNTPRHD